MGIQSSELRGDFPSQRDMTECFQENVLPPVLDILQQHMDVMFFTVSSFVASFMLEETPYEEPSAEQQEEARVGLEIVVGTPKQNIL